MFLTYTQKPRISRTQFNKIYHSDQIHVRAILLHSDGVPDEMARASIVFCGFQFPVSFSKFCYRPIISSYFYISLMLQGMRYYQQQQQKPRSKNHFSGSITDKDAQIASGWKQLQSEVYEVSVRMLKRGSLLSPDGRIVFELFLCLSTATSTAVLSHLYPLYIIFMSA